MLQRDQPIPVWGYAVPGKKSPSASPKKNTQSTIAAADVRWSLTLPAQPEVVGDTIVLQADTVAQPVEARYGWANAPDVNRFNAAGLPNSPLPYRSALALSGVSRGHHTIRQTATYLLSIT